MYLFYIDDLLLPVAPPELVTKIKNNNKTETTVGGKELTLVKLPGLTEWSFTALLPNTEYPFAVYDKGFVKADAFLAKFEELKTRKTVFDFTIIRKGSKDIIIESMPVKATLEDYSSKESFSDGIDFKVTLKLKAYTEYGTKTASINAGKINVKEIRNVDKKGRREYITKPGDTIVGLAKKYLGDEKKKSILYEKNKTAIDRGAFDRYGVRSSSRGIILVEGTKLMIDDDWRAL